MRLLCLVCIPALLLAAPKERARPVVASKAPGVKTPGVQIPFEKLKSEADVPLPALVPGAAFGESVWVAQKDSLAKIDPKTNKPGEAVTGLKQPCSGMVLAFGSLWVPDCGAKALVRLDPKTSKITATLPIGAGNMHRGIAASADSVWMFTDERVTLSRIDPDSNKVVAELRLPAGCNTLTFGENSLWVTCPSENKVLRVNPQTNLNDKRVEVLGSPRALAISDGSVWVLSENEGKVARIDPKTDKVTATIELAIPNASGDIAAGAGFIWVTTAGFPLTRIDPAGDRVVQQFYGEGGGGIQFGAGSLWLAHLKRGSLGRIDPKRVSATFAE